MGLDVLIAIIAACRIVISADLVLGGADFAHMGSQERFESFTALCMGFKLRAVLS